MSIELYFLRSSEQHIVKQFAKRGLPDGYDDEKFYNLYGLTTKDMGLYALNGYEIAGAIWCREFKENKPFLTIALLNKFQKQGIASLMMKQFLEELASRYELITTDHYNNHKLKNFYEKFGFEELENSSKMSKKLILKEIIRPKDNYDANHWID